MHSNFTVHPQSFQINHLAAFRSVAICFESRARQTPVTPCAAMNLSSPSASPCSSKRSSGTFFPSKQTRLPVRPSAAPPPPPLPIPRREDSGAGLGGREGGRGGGRLVTRADSPSLRSLSPDTGSARVTVTGAGRRSASQGAGNRDVA